MRVLIGHTNLIPELQQRLPLPGRTPHQDDILAFGNGHQQVAYELGMTWPELLAQCPRGWQPDAYLHWSLEYNPVPEGLETADCFTVGIVGDWNLGGQAFQQMGGVFDLLLADKAGGERLRRAGYENVAYARLWAYDPAVHRRMEGVERDLDIVMVGSFNHDVQQERARWLGRLAKLSRKYKICMTQGVYGEEYTRLLNRAKIVFNRSIGGGINMRAYEAPACGALLFYERENPEIREVFADRQECVLYGEDDLEDLLDYYLRHEEERARIAEAGHQKVAAHSYARHLSEILSTVEAAMQEQKPRNRYFLALPSIEQQTRRAYQWMVVPDLRNLVAAESALLRAQSACPERADIRNALACLMGEVADHLPVSEEQAAIRQQAIAHARLALEIQPDYAAARLNLAQLLQASSDGTADTERIEVIRTLQTGATRAGQLCGPYYPRRFEAFDVELERIWGFSTPESEDWIAAMRSLVLWRAWEGLSASAYTEQRYADSAQCAAEAVVLRPESATSHYRLAASLRLLGNLQGAEEQYRCALQTAPFLLSAWQDLAQLYLDAKHPAAALALLDELFVILDGCPVYDYVRPEFEPLRARARHRVQRQEAAADPNRKPTQRLLAFPDWQQPSDWQALVRAFAAHYKQGDPAVLMLRADPTADPPAESLLSSLETFLTGDLGLPDSELPNITLLNQPLAVGEEWTLFHVTDALIAVDATTLKDTYRAQAAAARVPIRTLEEMT